VLDAGPGADLAAVAYGTPPLHGEGAGSGNLAKAALVAWAAAWCWQRVTQMVGKLIHSGRLGQATGQGARAGLGLSARRRRRSHQHHRAGCATIEEEGGLMGKSHMTAIRKMARDAVLKRLPSRRVLDPQTSVAYENEANCRMEFLSAKLRGLWAAPSSGSPPFPVWSHRLEVARFACETVFGCERAAEYGRYAGVFSSSFVSDVEEGIPSGDILSRLGQEIALEQATLPHFVLHQDFWERICRDLRGEDFSAFHHFRGSASDLSAEYVWAARDAAARVQFLSFWLWHLGREASAPFSGSDAHEHGQEFVATTMVGCELAGLMSRENTGGLTGEDLETIEAETRSERRKLPSASSDEIIALGERCLPLSEERDPTHAPFRHL